MARLSFLHNQKCLIAAPYIFSLFEIVACPWSGQQIPAKNIKLDVREISAKKQEKLLSGANFINEF